MNSMSFQNLILNGLTDVWSAIRNACATRLSRIIGSFTIPQLECLFLELEKVSVAIKY